MNPALSVVIVAHSASETLRATLHSLRAQTAASKLEIVVMTPSSEDLGLLPKAFEGVYSHSVLELGRLTTDGKAKAAGVMAAHAPLVAFMEDHSYPGPGWVEALLEAHRAGDFAAVGPVMLNANPESGTSWGTFLVFYGPWMAAQSAPTHLPANQSCYRRQVLLEYGERLAEMLDAESVLDWDLIGKGRKLRHDPAAKVYHLNFSLLRPVLREYFLASRVFAANRARPWGRIRRAVYALGSPVLPALRIPRILQYARLARMQAAALLRALAPAISILAAGAAGEMAGYALGEGEAAGDLVRFEASRRLFVTPRDLAALPQDDHGQPGN